MNRDEILETACKIINGERAEQYGDAYLNHARIAALWNTYVRSKPDDLTPVDVAMMMVLMKVARSIETPKDDSFVDIAGYAALAGEIANVGK